MGQLTERQIEIIEAAGRLLTEHGVNGLTTKRLAKAVGFSEAAIYRHFKSKEDVIVGLLQYLEDDMERRFSAIDVNLPALIRFKEIFKTQLEFFGKNPQFIIAVFSDGLLEESEKINSHIFNIMQIKIKYLLPVVVQLQQEKVISSKISSEHMLHIIMGTFRLLMFKWKLTGFAGNIEENGDSLINSLLIVLKEK